MTRLAVAASAFAVICVSSCATSSIKEFRAPYRHRAAVANDGKLAAFLNETTPDYVVRLENGQTMSRDQLAQRFDAYLGDPLIKQLSFTYVVRCVDARDNQAIVEVEQRDKRIQRRKDGDHLVEAIVTHTDTWINTSAGWKLQRTQEGKQLKFTVDGKPPQ